MDLGVSSQQGASFLGRKAARSPALLLRVAGARHGFLRLPAQPPTGKPSFLSVSNSGVFTKKEKANERGNKHLWSPMRTALLKSLVRTEAQWYSDEETKAHGVSKEGKGTSLSTVARRCCWC